MNLWPYVISSSCGLPIRLTACLPGQDSVTLGLPLLFSPAAAAMPHFVRQCRRNRLYWLTQHVFLQGTEYFWGQRRVKPLFTYVLLADTEPLQYYFHVQECKTL